MKLLLTGMNTYDHEIVKSYYDKYLSGEISRDEYALYVLNCLELYAASLVGKFCFNKQDYEDKMSECRLQILGHLDEYDPEKASLLTYFKPRMLSVLYKYDGILGKINASLINKIKKALRKREITDYNDPLIWDHIDELKEETGISKKTLVRVINALNYSTCMELLDNYEYKSPQEHDDNDAVIETFSDDIEPEFKELFDSYVVKGQSRAQIRKNLHLSPKEYKRQMAKMSKSIGKIEKIREHLNLPKLEETDEKIVLEVV